MCLIYSIYSCRWTQKSQAWWYYFNRYYKILQNIRNAQIMTVICIQIIVWLSVYFSDLRYYYEQNPPSLLSRFDFFIADHELKMFSIIILRSIWSMRNMYPLDLYKVAVCKFEEKIRLILIWWADYPFHIEVLICYHSECTTCF